MTLDSELEKQLFDRAELFSQLMQSPAGQEFQLMILSIVDECVNKMGNVSDPMEAMRLQGGMRFGNQLLARLQRGINVGKQLREESKRRAQEASKALKETAQRNSRFTRDAVG